MTSRKKIAFLPAHPAQLWLLRPVAESVAEFADVVWIIRSKDCSAALADALGLDYIILSEASRGLVGNSIELFLNIFRCWSLTRRLGIDLWVTKYGCGNIAAWLSGKSSISFNDDDADIVPYIAWTSYPFADVTLVPDVLRMGRFEHKAKRYAGLHELFYLHPNRFTPDPTIKQELGLSPEEPYALIRLSALETHHDRGIRGVKESLLRQVVSMVGDKIRLFVTSEKPLSAEFEHLRFPLPPERILHALAHAEFLLGDSQTMTSEAAVLGTPAFRSNDFVGRLTAIAELERYELAFGFKPEQEKALLSKLEEVLNMPDRAAVFAQRRQVLLNEKIDPVPWMVDVIRQKIVQEKPAADQPEQNNFSAEAR